MAVHAESGLGLCHARLSLVDTSARSHQPMWDQSRRYSLIYNGEIYNFPELRSKLQDKGLEFETTSDTEVVLQYLIAFGSDALAMFNGMFGLAFVDHKTGEIILARDRFGMKPLYWAKKMVEGGEALLFGSEVKCFEPWIALETDQNSLSAYLMKFGGPTSGRSFYKGINALKPGTFMRLSQKGEIEITPFFQLTEFMDEGEMERLGSLSPNAVADEFEELMETSIRSQLFADARVGAFCSGGVDSSLITSIAGLRARQAPQARHALRGG